MSDKQDLKEEKKVAEEQSTNNTETTTNESKSAEQEPSAEENKGEEKQDVVEKLQSELAEQKDKHLRLYAEFENFRKRTAKERMDLFDSANKELMAEMLPVLDDFNRAAKANESGKLDEGSQLIYNKFYNTLKNKGLKPIEIEVGDDFDVEIMEAITRIPAPEDKLKGKVIDVVEPGFKLGSKMLRYAKVVVGE